MKHINCIDLLSVIFKDKMSQYPQIIYYSVGSEYENISDFAE